MDSTTQVNPTTETDMKLVDHRNITIEEDFNERTEGNYGDMEALALNVVANGVLEAVLGFKVRNEDRFVLTEGHRRHLAVRMAFKYHAEGKKGFEDISKIQKIPLRTSSSDEKERLLIMATTGFGKQPLTDMEKASLYNRIIIKDVEDGMKRGEAVKALVQRLGVSPASVYNTLKLNALPESIKAAIINKEISGGTVVTIIREIKDETEQIEAVKNAIVQAQASQKEGGKSKATARDVKGLKAKSPMQRLREVAEKIEENGLTNSNSRTKLLVELLVALEEKKSVNKILELFV